MYNFTQITLDLVLVLLQFENGFNVCSLIGMQLIWPWFNDIQLKTTLLHSLK